MKKDCLLVLHTIRTSEIFMNGHGMWSLWGHAVKKTSIEYPAVLNVFYCIAMESYCVLAKNLDKSDNGYSKKLEELKMRISEVCRRERTALLRATLMVYYLIIMNLQIQ